LDPLVEFLLTILATDRAAIVRNNRQLRQGDPCRDRRGLSFGVSLEATVSRMSAERLKVQHPVLVLFK
jgi:hypothetical protein